MKTTATILLTSVLPLGFASACTPATAEDVTPYFLEWGVIDEDDISTGGSSHCTNVLVEHGVDAWNQCIEDTILDIDVNFARRLAKTKRGLWLAGRQSALQCSSDEICGAFPAMPDQVFCMDPQGGEWHSADGSTGNWRTGDIHLADGTSGNIYTGESGTSGGGRGGQGGLGSGGDGDSGTSSATSFAAAGKAMLPLTAAIAVAYWIL